MIQLIQTLSGYQHRSVRGWFLAKAEWDFPSCSESAEFVLHVERKRLALAVLCARGVDRSGIAQDLLRIWLMKPPKQSPEPPKETVPEQAVLMRTFSAEDVQRYLSVSGDTNPIHTGSAPIVPGLMLLSQLMKVYPSHSGHIRFLAPCYAGEPIFIEKVGKELTGYTGDRKLFEVIQT